jgi:hypothetical protein
MTAIENNLVRIFIFMMGCTTFALQRLLPERPASTLDKQKTLTLSMDFSEIQHFPVSAMP